jgi:hypothetical protein
MSLSKEDIDRIRALVSEIRDAVVDGERELASELLDDVEAILALNDGEEEI